MAFPATPLDVEVSIALSADLSDPGSWSWTDITDYVRENMRIRIRRGRSSERSTIGPSRCTLTVDNTDGRFCRFLPTGAWYGQIGKNTPLRVRVNNGSGYVTRFIGYVSGWPPSWDPSENDQTVTLSADGILRRLGQGSVLRSALYRAILADNPAHFWPLDDESGSTQAASALAGGVPMRTEDTVEFASATAPVSSDAALVDAANGALYASFSPTSSTAYTLEFVYKVETSIVDGELYRFTTPAYTSSKSATASPTPDGLWHHYAITWEQTGSDVFREIFIDGVSIFSFTDVGGTLSPMIALKMNPTLGANRAPMSIGYVAIHNSVDIDMPARYQAMTGYSGEMAHDRVERLCTEEGIPVTTTATSSQAMGAQRSGALVTLLRECATTDFGLLYEPATTAGLAYLASSQRYNQTAAITLDYDAGQISPPWDPTDDDRDTRNDVTASRSGGSSARVTDETSIAAIGVYDDSISANTETDEQLADVAGWAVNLGTVDELRWPAVKPNFLGHPSLIDSWMAADIGDQLHVVDHPSPLAPDDIAQIIEGYDETFGSFEYTAIANLSPASGWTVAELDDDATAKLDTAGCELMVARDSDDTSWTVHHTVVPKWTTDAGEMNLPLMVAGERVDVTAVANVTVSYVGVGAAAHGNNASVAPALHASTAAGDLVVVFAAIRNSGTGTVDTPSGYTTLLEFGNAKLMAKYAATGEAAPTITFTGGVAGADTSAQAATFRGVGRTVYASTSQLNSSAADIAYPELNIEQANTVVLYLGWKQDDWTSVASPGTEIGEPDTTTGDDQGIVWAYTIQTTATPIASGSFTVTGGASAISRGAVVALGTDVQTLTVTRSVNSVAKSQAVGAALNIHSAARPAL